MYDIHQKTGTPAVAHIESIGLHVDFREISMKLGAWVRIEEETSRTLKRYFAGQRALDAKGPGSTGLSGPPVPQALDRLGPDT